MRKTQRHSDSIRLLCLSALMCALLILSTLLFRFPLPGTDVLFTLQVMAVLLCGLLLPLRYALYSVLGYIGLGLMGLPVFSSVCGPGAVFTPSFGFLLGFPAAVIIERSVLQKLQNKKSCDFVAALSGILLMYLVALAYITFLKGVWMQSAFSMREILLAYGLSFLPLDVVKAVLASLVAPRIRKALLRR